MSEYRNRVFYKSSESMSELPDGVVQTCVTSPPYWGLRAYHGNEGMVGLDETPEQWCERLVAIFAGVRRVLRADGVLWVNCGDAYASAFACARRNIVGEGSPAPDVKRPNRLVNGLKEKDLIGLPWMLAFALRADGWYLRSDIIWAKPNCMPSSVTDRCTTSHEYVFMLAKSRRYFFDADAIREPLAESSLQRLSQNVEAQAGSDRQPGKTNGPMKAVATGLRFGGNKGAGDAKGSGERLRNGEEWSANLAGANKRDVWTIATRGYKGAHFATFPEELARLCILAGSRPGELVLDPFMGSGTTARVALESGRDYVGYEIAPEYEPLIAERLGMFYQQSESA